MAEYNRHAIALTPPRPELSWTEVMELASVGEFDLLRDARQDIREKPWANRSHRTATATYFNVKRAREEIERLNVEMPRLFSAVIDDHVDYVHAIKATNETNPDLAHELRTRQKFNNTVNGKVVTWLQKAAALQGFSGRLVYGRRVGRDASLIDGVSLPPWAARASEQPNAQAPKADADDDDDDDDDDAIPGTGSSRDSSRFVKFIDRLGEDMD